MPDHYQVLGLQRDATAKDVKQAFLKMAQKYHPDVVSADERGKAETRFKQINEAYQVLGDTVKRRDYDLGGFRGGSGAGAYRNASPQWARYDQAWKRPRRAHVPWSAYFTSKGAATFLAATIPLAFGIMLISNVTDRLWNTINDGKAIKRVQEDVDKRAEERARRRAIARGQSW